jgi:hypothetical protein
MKLPVIIIYKGVRYARKHQHLSGPAPIVTRKKKEDKERHKISKPEKLKTRKDPERYFRMHERCPKNFTRITTPNGKEKCVPTDKVDKEKERNKK